MIDEDGKKVANKTNAFLQHKDEAFHKEFSALVKNSYEELFELHGDDAWKLDRPSLTQFFRTTDQTSDIVGQRQASTFSALAALSGHGDVPQASQPNKKKQASTKKGPKKAKKKALKKTQQDETNGGTSKNDSNVGLTVRIEVNLPADGDQETYDRIFRSIRENLIDGT